MTSFPHRSRFGFTWLWVLVPMLLTLGLSWTWTPDFPHADHWGLESDLMIAQAEGGVTWDLLATQKNDSRYVVSRLFFLWIGQATNWNLRVEAAMCVLMAGGIAVLAWWMVRRTVAGRLADLTGFFLALIILSPLQVMNWNFGVQICYFLPVAAAAGTAAVFMSRWDLARQTTAGIVFAMIASWSFASGFLVWGLVIWGVLGWLGRTHSRKVVWALGLTSLAMAGNVWFYFSGYHWPPGPSLREKLTSETWEVFRYFMDLLGAGFATGLPLGNQSRRLAIMALLAPVVAVALLAWIAVLLGTLRRELLRRTGSTPAWMWVGLGGWSMLLTGVIALARTGNVLSHQFSSRYLAFTVWAWIACLVLTLTLPAGRLRRVLLKAGLAVMILGWAAGVPVGIRAMQKEGYHMRLLQGSLTMSKVAPGPATLKRNDPQMHRILPDVQKLSARGYLRPPLVDSPLVADAAVVADPAIEGEITDLVVEPRLIVTGYAYDNRRQGPADSIVLSIQPDGGEEIWWTPVSSRSLAKQAKSLIKSHKLSGEHLRIGWRWEAGEDATGYNVVSLPTNRSCTVRAYVLDVRTGKFHPLPGEKTLSIPAAIQVP